MGNTFLIILIDSKNIKVFRFQWVTVIRSLSYLCFCLVGIKEMNTRASAGCMWLTSGLFTTKWKGQVEGHYRALSPT